MNSLLNRPFFLSNSSLTSSDQAVEVSGTSIREKTKVSHFANKKMKTLLDLCAKIAIQHNSEMKSFYLNRIKKGKIK